MIDFSQFCNLWHSFKENNLVRFFKKKFHIKLANGAANQHVVFIGTTQFGYQNINNNAFSRNDSLYEKVF